MKNPFEKLGSGEKKPEGEPIDKEKQLAMLKDWEAQVKAGMEMDAVPQDREQLDKIQAMIKKLEQS